MGRSRSWKRPGKHSACVDPALAGNDAQDELAGRGNGGEVAHGWQDGSGGVEVLNGTIPIMEAAW